MRPLYYPKIGREYNMQRKKENETGLLSAGEKEICFPQYKNKSDERCCTYERSKNNEAGKDA